MILPFLLMILHLSQIFFTDGLTFIVLPFLSFIWFYWFFMSHPTAFSPSALNFILFCSPCDAAFIKVVNGNLYGYLITGQNSDIVHSKLSRYVSRYYMLIGKLYLKGRVGQSLNYRTLKFNYVILWQNNPSSAFICDFRLFPTLTTLYLKA